MFYFFLIDFDVLSPDMTYEIADWLLFVRYLIFFKIKYIYKCITPMFIV